MEYADRKEFSQCLRFGPRFQFPIPRSPRSQLVPLRRLILISKYNHKLDAYSVAGINSLINTLGIA